MIKLDHAVAQGLFAVQRPEGGTMLSPDENKMQGNIEWLKTYNLGLEDVVSCDTVECSNPATYYAKVKCCGAVLISCEPCMHNAYKVVTFMVKSNKAVVCQGCNKPNNPKGWLSRPVKLSLLDDDKDLTA
jgi:hypothetical protein